jgi:uncharacterized RDD family membrane protein YckC
MTVATAGLALLQDDLLTRGVMLRRILAWLLDVVILAGVASLLFAFIWLFGVLTLGLGWTLFAVLPLLPALYGTLTVASPMQATLGQAAFGLIVVRDADLGRPNLAQALVCTLGYLLTMAVGVVWVAVALITTRRRTLHDIVSGLVVIRRRALDAPLTPMAGA